MLDAPGAGLAAPQIGVGLRVFTWNVDGEVGHLVNPQLDLSEEIQDGPEGCLSIPELTFDCRRALSVVAHGFDMYGEPVTIEGSDLLARAIQHETDHLDGVLFIDRLDTDARKAAMKAIRESDWFGLERPDGQGLARTPPAGWASDAGRLRRHPRGRPCPRWTRIAASRHELVGVVTRPDAPGRPRPQAGRQPGRPARRGARRTRPQARAPARPRVPGRRCAALAPDCCPVVAYGALLPQSALDIPAHGWVNLHFSVLPAWRGAAPVQHAIWAGDEVTGATTFRIVKELDAGPTFGVMTERIRPTDTAGDLLGRLAEGGAGLLVATLDGIEDGSLEARAAAGRGRQPRAEDPGRGRPRRLDASRRSRRPADPRLHARRPAPGRRTTGERIKLGPVTGRPSTALAPGRARGRQERRSWSAPAPTPCGSATSRRSARSRCPPPTGRAASGSSTGPVRRCDVPRRYVRP